MGQLFLMVLRVLLRDRERGRGHGHGHECDLRHHLELKNPASGLKVMN
jgi:predicted GNAT superfamily acetyltransferase